MKKTSGLMIRTVEAAAKMQGQINELKAELEAALDEVARLETANDERECIIDTLAEAVCGVRDQFYSGHFGDGRHKCQICERTARVSQKIIHKELCAKRIARALIEANKKQ